MGAAELLEHQRSFPISQDGSRGKFLQWVWESPSSSPLQHGNGGWDQGKAGTCSMKVEMAQGEVLHQGGLSVQTGKRRDWLGSRPTQSTVKFGRLIGHFEKAPSKSHIQTSIVPGERRQSLLLCLAHHSWWPGLSRCTHFFSWWATWPPGRSLSLFLSPHNQVMHLLVHLCNLVALAAAWHVATWLHMQFPRGGLKWTAAGNKIGYLDDHVAVTCGLQITVL